MPLDDRGGRLFVALLAGLLLSAILALLSIAADAIAFAWWLWT